MRPISQRVKKQISADPLSDRCFRKMALRDHTCGGRITLEHAFIYRGRQIDEVWAIVPICARAHGVDQYQGSDIFNKEINQWIAINRMTEEDEQKYPRTDWKQLRKYLNGKYGEFKLSTI